MVTLERVLAHEMPKALSTEPLLRFLSSDIVKKSLEVGDECEVSLPLEQVDASVVLLVPDLQSKGRLALIIVETED